MVQVTFLILLALALVALVGGQLWARSSWRPDTRPYGLHTNTVDVMLHPSRYVKAERVRTVRVWSTIGIIFLSAAAGVLTYSLVSVGLRGR